MLGHTSIPQMLSNIHPLSVCLQAGYHGVPIVGMPLFAEQPDNIARAIDRGFGLAVSVHSKTLAKDMEAALKRVLQEPSFAVSAARISRLIKARRWTPAETAASISSTHTSMALACITVIAYQALVQQEWHVRLLQFKVVLCC